MACFTKDSQNLEPVLMERISTVRKRCAIANKVDRDSIDVWNHGIASFAGIIAICITSEVRPRPAYRTVTEETSTILFIEADPDTKDVKFPWQEELVVDIGQAHEKIFKQLDPMLLAEMALDNISKRALYCVIIVTMLSLGFRGENYVRHARSVLNFLRDELRLPNAFAMELSELDPRETRPSPATTEKDIVKSVNSRLPEMLKDDQLSHLIDQCPIPGCGQAIGWDEIEEANCLGGHPLGGRCQITFLPILEPGVSKRCSDCYRQFLNELRHPELMGANPGLEEKPSLARHLLEWFDTCPYCGGKFFTRS